MFEISQRKESCSIELHKIVNQSFDTANERLSELAAAQNFFSDSISAN